MKKNSASRREFLKTTAVTGAGFWVAGRSLADEAKADKSPNERIRFACIGVGGKGVSDSRDASRAGDVVAICDIDEEALGRGAKAHKKAKQYTDWRKLLDEMSDSIDALTITTPDHTHAVIASAAIRAGKHVYLQKPLTRTLHEARFLGELAKKHNVATQMGNQGTADSNLRKCAALVKSGVLGPVKEVYVWTNRPVWPQGKERPAAKPAPSHIHWDLFLGPVPKRPYGDDYHPFSWRGWWDFGTGSLGDMACHTLNMPFMALDLRNPTSVQAVTTGHNRDSFPSKSHVTYEFGEYEGRAPLTLHWYDAKERPARELFQGVKGNVADTGSLIIGEKGKLYTPGDYASETFQLIGVEEQPVEFTRSPGHFAEFVRAIKGGEAARSNFVDYAVPLTETVLLGNLAIWAADQPDIPGKKIEWDAAALRAKNAPELDELIRPEYQNGYSLT
jgi:predicted dehydrogenase